MGSAKMERWTSEGAADLLLAAVAACGACVTKMILALTGLTSTFLFLHAQAAQRTFRVRFVPDP